MSGRRQKDAEAQRVSSFLRMSGSTRPRVILGDVAQTLPRVMAGTALGSGQSHILVLGGADGSLFSQGDILRDNHPGFPKKRWHITRLQTPGLRLVRFLKTMLRRLRHAGMAKLLFQRVRSVHGEDIACLESSGSFRST